MLASDKIWRVEWKGMLPIPNPILRGVFELLISSVGMFLLLYGGYFLNKSLHFSSIAYPDSVILRAVIPLNAYTSQTRKTSFQGSPEQRVTFPEFRDYATSTDRPCTVTFQTGAFFSRDDPVILDYRILRDDGVFLHATQSFYDISWPWKFSIGEVKREGQNLVLLPIISPLAQGINILIRCLGFLIIIVYAFNFGKKVLRFIFSTRLSIRERQRSVPSPPK